MEKQYSIKRSFLQNFFRIATQFEILISKAVNIPRERIQLTCSSDRASMIGFDGILIREYKNFLRMYYKDQKVFNS
jgi:hypothetical protein